MSLFFVLSIRVSIFFCFDNVFSSHYIIQKTCLLSYGQKNHIVNKWLITSHVTTQATLHECCCNENLITHEKTHSPQTSFFYVIFCPAPLVSLCVLLASLVTIKEGNFCKTLSRFSSFSKPSCIINFSPYWYTNCYDTKELFFLFTIIW